MDVDIEDLVAALSDPAAFQHERVNEVEVRRTHISVVFLAGSRAYKIKKPVRFDFLDFSTLQKRRRFCEREVELNRRLAPDVYLGVEPVTRSGREVRIGGNGETVEYAVVMRRLPDDATLAERLRAQRVDDDVIAFFARTIARFHERAERGSGIARHARFAAVREKIRGAVDEAGGQVGRTVSARVLERYRAGLDASLERLRPLIESRAAAGVPCDGHGDLRLEHVYVLDDRLVVLDCIEFDDRIRCLDPVSDAAFPVMELNVEGRRDLGERFIRAYLEYARDEQGHRLLPLYTAYRAAVRAKVRGLELDREDFDDDVRRRVASRARALWLYGLGELAAPGERPCLVLVGGLPGTGKTTLARSLARDGAFRVIRSDRVRKELAGADPRRYAPRWTERVYDECRRRAREAILEGERVIVDATFRTRASRELLFEEAERMAVPARMLICEAPRDVARERLRRRTGDLSEADEDVYDTIRSEWEPVEPRRGPVTRRIPAAGDPGESHRAARDVLREHGLIG